MKLESRYEYGFSRILDYPKVRMTISIRTVDLANLMFIFLELIAGKTQNVMA